MYESTALKLQNRVYNIAQNGIMGVYKTLTTLTHIGNQDVFVSVWQLVFCSKAISRNWIILGGIKQVLVFFPRLVPDMLYMT